MKKNINQIVFEIFNKINEIKNLEHLKQTHDLENNIFNSPPNQDSSHITHGIIHKNKVVAHIRHKELYSDLDSSKKGTKIISLVVHPDHQKKSYGSKLIKHLQKKYHFIYSGTDNESNKEAMTKLHNKLGFKKTNKNSYLWTKNLQ